METEIILIFNKVAYDLLKKSFIPTYACKLEENKNVLIYNVGLLFPLLIILVY